MKSNHFKNRTGKLQVAANNHYLAYEDGSPFFYLGDTAWELFHRLNREEAQLYLKNRADKGFTVIQSVVIAELGTTDVPNAYGELPLINRDPAKPNQAYFRHVDDILGYAEELGLFIGMLPTWGSVWMSVIWPSNSKTRWLHCRSCCMPALTSPKFKSVPPWRSPTPPQGI